MITQPSESCSRTRVTSNEVVAVGCDKEIRFQRLDTLGGPLDLGDEELLARRHTGQRVHPVGERLTGRKIVRRPDRYDVVPVPDEAVVDRCAEGTTPGEDHPQLGHAILPWTFSVRTARYSCSRCDALCGIPFPPTPRHVLIVNWNRP